MVLFWTQRNRNYNYLLLTFYTMKKLLLFAALVLGAVSCMKDNSFDANAGGEAEVVLSVALPADVTRAINQDSAKGAIGNIDLAQYDIRYILEVFDASNTLAKRVENYENSATSTTFELRLIPGRHYSFVVWADFVDQGSEDALHYNAESLREIEIIGGVQNAMDESRDAYTGIFRTSDNGGQPFSSSSQISFELKRPFAKLRVVTNDKDEIYSDLVGATIEYTAETYQQYDALTKVSSEPTFVTKSVDYTSEAYKYDGEPTEEGVQTLFADYILGTQNGTVQFIMTVEDSVQELPAINFNTAIPVQTNYLTTIYGPILTDSNNVTVTINPAFENKDDFEEAPYYQVAVTNGVELIKALMQGREIIVLNDITVTAADLAEATRAGESINPVINLNGFTITVENNEAEALVNLNGGVLTVEGEGAIESTAGALVKGNTVVTGEATVDAVVAVDENGDSAVKTGIDALVYICENGGEFNFTEDLTAADVILVSATEPVVINGANYKLSTSANRAIRVTSSKANVTVNDLNVVSSAVMTYPSDVRGISIDASISEVTLELNNCTIDFTDKTTNDWTYAVNVSGNGTGHKVTINGGVYEGANVVNAHSAKNTIVVKNATLTSLYPDTANYISSGYYGACIWVLQNQGSSVYAEGNTFNGNNAKAFNLGTGTTLEEKDNIDNTMFYYDGTCYVGSSEKFQKAIAEGANNIVLGKGTFDLPSSLTQKEGTLTIKGRGNDVTVLNGAINTNGNNPGNYANGVALEFEGLTFKTANNGYNGGFGHAVSVTFRESKIVGQFYAHSSAPHYFYDCTIDPKAGYLYTYGSDCVFEGCTFAASEGKALQIYEDAASGENTVTITNCAFVAAKQATTWDGKPVTGIDINSNGAKFEVYINNCTTTGFPTGLNSNSNLWNVKDAGKAHANVYVDGVQVWFGGYETVAEGLLKKNNAYVVMNAEGLVALNTMMANKTAGKSVKVTLGADIDFTGKTWTPVDSHADSAFYFNELNGNGKTISNLTINGQAMFTRFAGFGDVTIKNITFDNATVNSNGNINTSILTVQTYQNVLLDNVDVKNSTITGGYKVAPLIATVYNEGSSTITATLKNCDVENTVVKATSYDFCTTGMVAFVYEGDNDRIVFENCSVKGVKLYAPKSYTAHAAIYTAGSETLYNEAEGVVVENVTFENI